jgi:hypothetical protein
MNHFSIFFIPTASVAPGAVQYSRMPSHKTFSGTTAPQIQPATTACRRVRRTKLRFIHCTPFRFVTGELAHIRKALCGFKCSFLKTLHCCTNKRATARLLVLSLFLFYYFLQDIWRCKYRFLPPSPMPFLRPIKHLDQLE